MREDPRATLDSFKEPTSLEQAKSYITSLFFGRAFEPCLELPKTLLALATAHA